MTASNHIQSRGERKNRARHPVQLIANPKIDTIIPLPPPIKPNIKFQGSQHNISGLFEAREAKGSQEVKVKVNVKQSTATMMLSKHAKPINSNGPARALSVMSSNAFGRTQPQHHQLQQHRTILGLIPALDKRIYRLAKGVMPPISKTEQIALGCGTIGKSNIMYRTFLDCSIHTGYSTCTR